MSAYTVSRLALEAGVSVHIVRDYLVRGLLRPVACTTGGYGLFDDALLQHLSPLGWEHINLTGDYLWRSSAKIGAGKFRPLRPLQPA